MTAVDIPIPPSVNALWRAVRKNSGGVRVVKSKSYAAWLESAVLLLRVGLPVCGGAVGVRIALTGGTGWAANRDVDNAAKAVLDALKLAGRIADDDCTRVPDVYVTFTPGGPGVVASCRVQLVPAGHLARLEALVEVLADRVAAQSELLSRKSAHHPKGDQAASPVGPFLLYRVTLNPAALVAVEFDALDGTSEEDLREQAAIAFMDWFDTVDWSAGGSQIVAYERVPEAEASQLTPKAEQEAGLKTQAEPAPEVRTPAPAPGPVVCAPVGAAKLRDIPGIEPIDAQSLEDFGVRTLADLEARCEGLDGSLNQRVYKALLVPKGPFAGHLAHQIANAVAAHLGHETFGPQQPKAKKKGQVKA